MTTTKSQYEALRTVCMNLLEARDIVALRDGEMEEKYVTLLSDATDILLIEWLGWSAERCENSAYEDIIELCEEALEELND